MANANWFFRGVKGDQVGPVSSDTMYSLFAKGTLTAETHVAAAAPTGEPDVWVEAMEVAAFRSRIEARAAKSAKKLEARERELQSVKQGSRFAMEPVDDFPEEENSHDMVRMASKPRFVFPDFGFQYIISPILVKLVWVFTVVFGTLWIIVNVFGFAAAVFQYLASSPSAFDRVGYPEPMQIGFPMWMPILFSGANILYGLMAMLYVRVMLEVVVVTMRIGKAMGCTDGEPDLSSPSR